jgi:hypothetical protein
MRASWGTFIGGVVAVAGAVVWAVSLAIYQQRMEPTGFYTDPTNGQLYPHLAQNNTYWPREMRHLGILLALAGVVVIRGAAVRALVAAGALGVVWLAGDLWLDRIDIDGRPAAVWLALGGCVAVAAAAVVSRGGTPMRWGRHLAAGAAALLAVGATSITPPWDEPITGADRVAIDNAITTMSIAVAVGFIAVAVVLVAPAMATVRSRWLVPILAAVTLAGTVLVIANSAPGSSAVLGLMALAVTMVAAAEDVPITRLLLVGAGSIVLAPCIVVAAFVSVAMPMGRIMTVLAGNPAVNSADTDLAIAVPTAFIGLVLSAASTMVIGYAPKVPAPA